MIALLALLQRWPWVAAAAALSAAAVASGWLVHRLDAPSTRRAEARAVAAEAQARAAAAQVRLDAAAAAAVDTARITETKAAQRTGDAAHAIARLPHAEDILDREVLSEWAAAVDGLRDQAAAARPPAAPARGGDPARAVPPT